MGDRKAATIIGLLVLAVIPFVVDDAFALDYRKHVTAEDLGILQLAAHDLFNVNRCIGQPMCVVEDHEDGRLNLSTLFEDTVNGGDFDQDTIAMGGEPRNRENIMLFTVASELGEIYVDLLSDNIPENVAKNMVVMMYHERLADTYQKTFAEEFPPRDDSSTSQTELDQQNLAFRTIHDFLPGKIKFGNGHVSTLDPSLIGDKLNKKELQQKSSKLDGKFDEEFLHIDICIPNGPCIVVNLLEADKSFGVQFGTAESFVSFLEEIEDGLYDEDDSVMIHIRTLIGKGQSFPPY